MGTVEGKKQEKRRALLEAAYDLFLERGAAKTSVEDITSRAKVAKGTFYLYFQDKGAVMQALLGRVSYQLLSDACEAVEKQTELENFPDKMVAVIDHIIEALRKDTLVLKFLEHNFIWPGLDQIEASREAEPLMRKLLNVVLTSPEMAGRTERECGARRAGCPRPSAAGWARRRTLRSRSGRWHRSPYNPGPEPPHADADRTCRARRKTG